MAYRASIALNNTQSAGSNVASGVIPGQVNDIVVAGVVGSSGTATTTITDTGDGGWTQLNTPNPDVVATNTNVALFAKKLSANDVGKTLTMTSSVGGIRYPGMAIAMSGRTTVADIILTRTQDVDGGTTIIPGGVTTPVDGYDILSLMFSRAALTTALSITTIGSGHTKRAEASTAFAASPNFAATVSSNENLTAGSGRGSATHTYNQAVAQNISYVLGLKAAPVGTAPVANAGADQIDVEPYTTVTLVGTDTDVENNVTTRVWTPPAGVTLDAGSGATRTARMPGTIAGADYVFTYTATDATGLSGSDTVTVSVLPVTERVARGGAWIPVEVRNFSAAV